MKSRVLICSWIFAGAFFATTSSMPGDSASRANTARRTMLEVCADPKLKCDSTQKSFAPYELPLRLPSSLQANVPYTSAPFYAVVLRTKSSISDTDCDGGEYTRALEAERQRVQALFPRQKVFADHQCPDMGAVGYKIEGQPSTQTMLAVYGGKTRRAAEQTQKVVQRRYSKAVIRRMNVLFERIVQ